MTETARVAGKELLTTQASVKVLEQDYKDFVTAADLRSEEFILGELNEAFPRIPAYAEESGGLARAKGLLWIVDPIDGTVNYAHQDDHWGVSIALVEDGKTIAGATYFPSTDEMFYADCADERYSGGLSACRDITQAQIWLDWGKPRDGEKKGDVTESVSKTFKLLGDQTRYPQLRLSCTASLAAVARGNIDGYVFERPEPFDFAAMAFIVEKFGGKVTEFDGSPWHAFSKSIVATNGHIHDDLL